MTLLPDGLAVPDGCAVPPTLGPRPPIPRSAWALAAAALAVRAAAALLDPVPPRDGIALAQTVRAVADGRFGALLEATHPPLAALAAAPFAAAGLDPVAALALVAILCGAAAVLPLHSLSRRLLDEDAANAAALLYAIAPPLVRLGSRAFAEAPLHLLVLLSLVAAVRALHHFRPARDAALAGLAAAGAYLARAEGLALVPVLLLAPLPAGGGRPWRNRVAGVLAGLLAFGALAGPWVFAASGRRGRIEIVPGKSTAVLAGLEAPVDPGGAAPAERRGPAEAALRALGALPEAIHPVPAAFLVLGLVALAGLERCGRVRGPFLLPLLAAALLLGGVALLEWRYGYGGRRYASTAGVVLLPVAGAGFLLAGRLLSRLGGPLARPVVCFGLLAAAVALPLAAGALLERDEGGADARAIALRLRALQDRGAPPRIATFGEPRVAWYAGGEDVRLLREFGVRPGETDPEARRRTDALRWFLRGRTRADFVVLREGDDRVPPGFPGKDAGPPAAAAGGLRAWRVESDR